MVTDHGQFAYLCDVFVLPAHRGQGLGKALVASVVAHPELQGLRRFALDAADAARSLYAGLGYSNLADPSGHMEIVRKPWEIWPLSRD